MSSSSSSVSATTVNGTTRITGLSSGIDVDSIVEQLMTANETKLNRLKQQETLTEWRQDAYREITTDITEFKSTYFDTSSDSCILSASNFNAYSVTSSSSAVTASYTSSAKAGSHTVEVNQLATEATYETTGTVSSDIVGTISSSSITYSSLAGTSFVMTVDDTDYTVTLGSSVSSLDDVQDAIDTAVGSGKVTISADATTGYLTIGAVANSGVSVIEISKPTSSSATSALSTLGFTSGQSNRISTSSTLETLSSSLGFTFSDDQVEFSINGTSFSFDKDTTLSSMMSKINSSDAGVTMTYDEINDKLVLTADDTGAGTTIEMSETGSTFISKALGTYTEGTDCKLTVDGTAVTRSSNVITVDGVTYTANAVTYTADTTDTTAATVSLTQDVDTIYDNISNFVDAYNELISTINEALDEEYDSDYAPLTEDQEAEMSDTEIEKWTETAKTGLLEGDSTLRSFLTSMRSVLMSSVSELNLSEIGIKTGTYDKEGQLYIDEDTLKEAIQSDSESIANLFTQSSTSYSGGEAVSRTLTSSERTTRYNEEGLGYRLLDVLADYVSTYTDNIGNKGKLLEKAGIEDDLSDDDNALSDQLEELADRIDKEQDRLDELSDRLYSQYTTLETYISEMNSQLSAISSITSSDS